MAFNNSAIRVCASLIAVIVAPIFTSAPASFSATIARVMVGHT
jgi:hypothetical protein